MPQTTTAAAKQIDSNQQNTETCQQFDTCQKLIIAFGISCIGIITIIIGIRLYLRRNRRQKQMIVQVRPINVTNLIRIQLSQSLALKTLQDQSQQQDHNEHNNQNDFKQSQFNSPHNNNNNNSNYQDIQNNSILDNLPIQQSLPALPRQKLLSKDFFNQRNAIKQQQTQFLQQENQQQQQQSQQQAIIKPNLNHENQQNDEEQQQLQKIRETNSMDNIQDHSKIKQQQYKKRKYKTISDEILNQNDDNDNENSNNQMNNISSQMTQSEIQLRNINQEYKIRPSQNSLINNNTQNRKNKLLNNFSSTIHNKYNIDESLRIQEQQE